VRHRQDELNPLLTAEQVRPLKGRASCQARLNLVREMPSYLGIIPPTKGFRPKGGPRFF